MTIRTFAIAAALASVVALSACSSGDTPAEHSAADRAEGHTSSSAGLPAGHIAAGETLAKKKFGPQAQSCVDCHGPDGNAPNAEDRPKLGGQYHDYIAHALQAYRDGDRTNAIMAGQAAELTDQQIADLAAYFSSRPSQLKDLHGVH